MTREINVQPRPYSADQQLYAPLDGQMFTTYDAFEAATVATFRSVQGQLPVGFTLVDYMTFASRQGWFRPSPKDAPVPFVKIQITSEE
jgi:hypothetical protein